MDLISKEMAWREALGAWGPLGRKVQQSSPGRSCGSWSAGLAIPRQPPARAQDLGLGPRAVDAGASVSHLDRLFSDGEKKDKPCSVCALAKRLTPRTA